MLGVEATLSPIPENPLMSATQHRPRRRSARQVPVTHLGKPHGLLAPRVQAVGPEHFGIVAVDPAKARSYWMLADFYGRILIPGVRSRRSQGIRPDFDGFRRAGALSSFSGR